MYFDYLTVLVFAAVGLVFVFANMLIASVIRPKRDTDVGLEIYECGEDTIGSAWFQFDIRYYTVALVYVVFAVEIAFLFPWALVLKESVAGTGAALDKGIGVFALVEGVLFILILFLGLAYVWVKGDLDWVIHWDRREYNPPGPRMKVEIAPAMQAEEEAAEEKGRDDGEAA